MKNPSQKLLGFFLLLIGILVVGVTLLAFPHPFPRQQQHGVTFSAPHATGIGLDWQEAYDATLEELNVKQLRLSAYWDTIEPQDDDFDFTALDYQMDGAAESGAQVILGIGRKLPRWPECHVPAWARQLPEAEQQAQVLEMLPVVINRYKDYPNLRMWQLENEPLLDFGDCPHEDREFLRREEKLVRSLDVNHPILITDSGELNSWLGAARFGDIVGTTMYRTVFSSKTNDLFHYDYLFPSWLYRLKSRYVALLRGKDVLISELQGEPWGATPFPEMTSAERLNSFSPERFRQLHGFAARTQLPEAYWWGVEYWYWERIQGDERYWEYAKQMFSNN